MLLKGQVFAHKQYSRAAWYAIESKDNELLENIISACCRDYIKASNYNDLRIWFQALNDMVKACTMR